MRVFLIVLMLAGCAPAYADAFDEALEIAARAYVETYPNGESAGWVRTMMDEIEDEALPAEVDALSAKAYLVAVAEALTSKDGNHHRTERYATFAHTVHTTSSGLVVPTMTAQEFRERLRRAVDAAAPPPAEVVSVSGDGTTLRGSIESLEAIDRWYGKRK